jgi:hypothetical protein
MRICEEIDTEEKEKRGEMCLCVRALTAHRFVTSSHSHQISIVFIFTFIAMSCLPMPRNTVAQSQLFASRLTCLISTLQFSFIIFFIHRTEMRTDHLSLYYWFHYNDLIILDYAFVS